MWTYYADMGKLFLKFSECRYAFPTWSLTPDNKWEHMPTFYFHSRFVSNIAYLPNNQPHRQEWVIKISVTSFTISVSSIYKVPLRTQNAVRKLHKRVIGFAVGGIGYVILFSDICTVYSQNNTYLQELCMRMSASSLRNHILYTSMPSYMLFCTLLLCDDSTRTCDSKF